MKQIPELEMNHCYQYPRPAVTTDAIIIASINRVAHVLLIERANEPFAGRWALPGGFLEMDEDLETCCKRELLEETGVVVEKLDQFYTAGNPERDPRHRTISIVFYAFIDSAIEPKSGDDAANAKWISLNNLPKLAFDHGEILERFIKVNL